MDDLINKKILTEIVIDSLTYKIWKEVADNWKSPIWDIVNGIIMDNSDIIKKLLSEILESIILDASFKKTIKEEFKRKVAKNIIWKLEGAIEKNINKFRQDPVINAQMINAIDKIISH